MEVSPLGNRILIRPEEVEEKTAGGIYIPDSAKEKTSRGIVVEIGDGKDIKVVKGDKVIFETYSGTEVKIKGVRHILMEYKDVLALVR